MNKYIKVYVIVVLNLLFDIFFLIYLGKNEDFWSKDKSLYTIIFDKLYFGPINKIYLSSSTTYCSYPS